MSSVGQALGGVAGAIAGFLVGGPAGALKGASLGLTIGGIIDPPKGPEIIGPRLQDLSTQTSTYGAVIPRVYGTVPVVGNVFFLENNQLKEVSTTEEQGGKGGGGQEVTTFSYFATFAVGLCKGPIAGVRRIWVGPNLIYDAGSDDLQTIIASNRVTDKFRIYLGTEEQLPDHRMQATKGADCPAYRGLAYIMFYDFPLKDYGNSLMAAQVKVEVISNGAKTRATYPVPTTVSTAQVMDWPQYNGGLFSMCYGPNTTSSHSGMGRPVGSRYIFGPDGFIRSEPVAYPALPSLPGVLGAYYLGEYRNQSVNWIYNSSDASSSGLFIGATRIEPNITLAGADLKAGRLYVFTNGGAYRVYDSSGSIDTFDSKQPFVGGTGGQFESYKTITVESNLKYAWSASGSTATCYEINQATGEFVTLFTKTAPTGQSFAGGSAIADDGLCFVHSVGPTKRAIIYSRGENISNDPAKLSAIIQSECLKSNLLSASDIDVAALTQDVRGYRINTVSAIRGGIDPLQGAWPFDVVQSGYQIKFKPRGGSSVVTIPVAKLDARSVGQAPGVQVMNSREMDSVLPSKVTLKYFDAEREYDNGEQYAERLNTPSVNVTQLEMALVLTADEAAQKAEILLYLYWLERYDVSFKLPPEYDGLEPADVITITGENAVYELRLTSINYTSDGRLECTAKYNNAAVYTSSAKGSEGQPSGQTITLAGPTKYELLDIPLIDDALDTAGFPVAMAGYLGGWPGGILMRSDDTGQTWGQIAGFTRPGSTLGTASNTLAAHGGMLIDKLGRLTVTMNKPLYSVTELQMLNGSNHFAYGTDGRWEIIAAQNCVEQVDGSFVLTDFLRGRYGTEWATGLHQANDTLVLLNISSLQFIGTNINTIGLARTYRAITLGANLDSNSNRSFTYAGVNLECLSPVYLNGNRHPTTNDWSLTWIRRTRVGGALRDYVDVPLGEASEAYDVEIYTSAAYTTLKRTISVTSPAAAYSSANQIADFGSNQATLYLKIYQLSATVGRGYPLIQSITR